ncbi:MAG: transposase, partial [Polaribacter sp.]
MSRKVKYKYDFKLRCVKQVLNHHQTVDAVSKL